jgi:hypothetical protein
MSNPKSIAVLAALLVLLVTVACEDSREYDLKRGPRLTLEEVTSDHVRISWDAYGDAQELRIERKRAGGRRFKVIAKLLPDVNEYTDDTVEDGRTYKYRLRGMFFGGTADRSVILAVEVPEAVVPLAARVAFSGKLSPDGTALARVIDERVLITDLVSGITSPATLGEFGPETDFAWMADSRRIVLIAGGVEAGELYLYDPESGESRLLATGAAEPELTPDGRFLLYLDRGIPVRLALPEGR